MLYRINSGELEYKDGAGEWTPCVCPFVTAQSCGLVCPLFRRESIDAAGFTRAFLTCGSGREMVLVV